MAEVPLRRATSLTCPFLHAQAIIYSAFLRKVRGHLFHLRFDRRRKQDDRARDSLLGEDGVEMELSRR